MKMNKYIIILLNSVIYLFPFISNGTPAGFVGIISEPGVNVYKKDNCINGLCIVQVVDLSRGASINLMHGAIVDEGENTTIKRESLSQTWKSFAAKEQKSVCITNGQFFSTNVDPTSLAFPVAIKGKIIEGYGSNEYQNKKMVLQFNSNRASITKFQNNTGSLADNLIVGLSEHADKQPNSYIGRTFIGVYDENKDGYRDKILILNASSARQEDAARILRDFGATELMMLDGGGSTQLVCKDKSLISSSRTIPQTIGVISGTEYNTSEAESSFRCIIDDYICWSPSSSSCINSQLLIYKWDRYYNNGTLRMWAVCNKAYQDALSEGIFERELLRNIFLGKNDIFPSGMCYQ